jgi:glycine/D-amino acid oxidase-like deaminating enzyme
LVLVYPARLVRAERDLVQRLGVKVFENSPVEEISSGVKYKLKTPQGTLTSNKLAFATNAYTHLFPELKRKQIPAFTYMIATEPLTGQQLEPLGWQGREGIEDARNLIHYYRITPDNRLVIGGGPVGLTYANDLDADSSQPAWQHLEEHMRWLFPSLKLSGLPIAGVDHSL